MRGGFLTVLEGEEAKIKVLAGPVSGEDTSPGSWVAVCGLRPHGVEVGRELPGVSFIRHESHHGLCTSQGPLLIHHTGCEDLTCQFGGGGGTETVHSTRQSVFGPATLPTPPGNICVPV